MAGRPIPPVAPNSKTEENEPARVPARRLSPIVIALLVVAGVGLVAACAVTVIAAGMIVVTR